MRTTNRKIGRWFVICFVCFRFLSSFIAITFKCINRFNNTYYIFESCICFHDECLITNAYLHNFMSDYAEKNARGLSLTWECVVSIYRRWMCSGTMLIFQPNSYIQMKMIMIKFSMHAFTFFWMNSSDVFMKLLLFLHDRW